LTTKFPCLQEMPPFDPVEQGDGGDWDTVGEPAGGSRSPAPTVEELLAQMERQPPVAQGSTEPAAAATEEVEATEAQEEWSPSITMMSKRCRQRATIWCGRTSLSATRIKVRGRLVGYLLMVA
jgi:hypothetical protein